MKQHTLMLTNMKNQSDLGDQQRQQREQTFSNELKDKLKELVEERQEDINMITKMLENNLKKMNSELTKVHEFVKLESAATEKK